MTITPPLGLNGCSPHFTFQAEDSLSEGVCKSDENAFIRDIEEMVIDRAASNGLYFIDELGGILAFTDVIAKHL